MLNDHMHFKTKDGIIFTTRGFYHSTDCIRSVPLYKPSAWGSSLEKDVDEFGDIWLYRLHPEYVLDSNFGRGIFVPIADIAEVYDPFSSEKTMTLEDTIGKEIVNFLLDVGISKDSIGLLGSRLVDTGNKPHDIDLIIRGIKNLNLVRKNLTNLLKLIEGKNLPPDQYIESSISRYEIKYNREFNSFKEMIFRRWPTIYVPGKFFGKLRFTYQKNEVPAVELPLGEKITNVSLKGRVVDAFGTNFMPRNFMLDSHGRDIKAMTYFWDFSYCVQEGDEVIVRGDYFPDSQHVLICNPKQHGIKIN